jgi:hypothetical protein
MAVGCAQVCLAVILYGKSMAQKLADSGSFCTAPGPVAACNAALPWASDVPDAAACPPDWPAPCRLSQAWGAASLGVAGAGWGAAGAGLGVPLGVNASVHPARSFALAAAPCRVAAARGGNGSLAWVAAGELSQECVRQARPTGAQWRAALAAGWPAGFANATPCAQCLCGAAMGGAPAEWWDAVDAWPHAAGTRTPGGGALCTAQAVALAQFSGLQAAAIVVVVRPRARARRVLWAAAWGCLGVRGACGRGRGGARGRGGWRAPRGGLPRAGGHGGAP